MAPVVRLCVLASILVDACPSTVDQLCSSSPASRGAFIPRTHWGDVPCSEEIMAGGTTPSTEKSGQ